MSKVLSIVEQARAAGISDDIIKTLTRRDLCSLLNSNQLRGSAQPVADVAWDVVNEIEEKDGQVLVDWAPTCATYADFLVLSDEFPVESFEVDLLRVEWKPSWIPASELTKAGLREVKETLEKRDRQVRVSWKPSCIDLETYSREQLNIERILNSNAVRIRWPQSWVPRESITKPSESVDDDDGDDDDDQGWQQTKRQRTCAPSESIDRSYDPNAANIVVQPDFPASDVLLSQGQKILESAKKLKGAEKVFSKRWKDSVLDDLKKLYYIDNPGNGDCGYYALAPMIRALKPNLFQGIPENDTDRAMIRLRQLLAAKLGATSEKINEYVRTYADQFTSAKDTDLYLKNLIDKNDPDLEQKRLKIQNEMIQSSHWAHLSDFSLLHDLLGPSVNIIIMQSNYGPNVPPFHLIGNSKDLNAKSILIFFTGNHFVRLQAKTGQFAFSKQELEELLPKIAEMYEETVNPANVNMELNRLKEDFLARNHEMAGIPQTDDSDEFYNRFLGFPKNREVEMITALIPQVKRYSLLSPDEKIAVQTLLLEQRQQAQSFVPIARRTVSKKVDKSQDQEDDVDDDFCKPLTEAEEVEVKQLINSAKTEPQKILITIGGIALTGEILSRLRPNGWFNDEIVNLYLKILIKNSQSRRKTVMFNSYFYQLLSSKRGFEAVERWKVYPEEKKYDYLLIPVNMDKHWLLCLVDMEKRKITIFDSLCSTDDPKTEIFKNLRQYLKKTGVDVTDWKYQVGLVPQQDNNFDCGAFILGYAKQLLEDNFEKFTFAQKDIACFRKRILLEFLRNAE